MTHWPNVLLSAALLVVAGFLIIVAVQPRDTGLKAVLLAWVTLP